MRPLAAEHEALYCGLYTDAALMQHVGPPLALEQARRGFARDCKAAATSSPRRALWAIVEEDSGQACGLLALVRERDEPRFAEIGALLSPDRHNRGYAAEAIAALIAHAFCALDVERLHTRHLVANGSAGGLMVKLGFDAQRTGDGMRWELQRSHWPAVRARLAMLAAGERVAFASPPDSVRSDPK